MGAVNRLGDAVSATSFWRLGSGELDGVTSLSDRCSSSSLSSSSISSSISSSSLSLSDTSVCFSAHLTISIDRPVGSSNEPFFSLSVGGAGGGC